MLEHFKGELTGQRNHGPSASVEVVNKKSFSNCPKQQQKQSQTYQTEQRDYQKSCCLRCRKTERHPRYQCSASNFTCGTLGHYAIVCLKRKSWKNVQRVAITTGGEESFQEEEDDAGSNESYALNINSSRVRSSWKIQL